MVRDRSRLTEELIEIIAPLEADEERRAIDAALGRFEGRRMRVYGAELASRSVGERPDRGVTVLVADLDPYLPIEVVVDADGAVVDVVERPELVPPFSAAEISDALAHARRESAVGELAERWAMRSAPFYPSTHSHDADERRRDARRVGVHFLDVADEAGVMPLVSVVVNLTSGETESVRDHRAERED